MPAIAVSHRELHHALGHDPDDCNLATSIARYTVVTIFS
jgi:hypothetical protein